MEEVKIELGLSLEEAMKYYKKGGELKKIALKAFPNIKELIEKAKEERVSNAKKLVLLDIKKKFPIGTVFHYDNGIYKVVSEPQIKERKRFYNFKDTDICIELMYIHFGKNDDDIKKAMLRFSPSSTAKQINNSTPWFLTHEDYINYYWMSDYYAHLAILPNDSKAIDYLTRDLIYLIEEKKEEIKRINNDIKLLENLIIKRTDAYKNFVKNDEYERSTDR